MKQFLGFFCRDLQERAAGSVSPRTSAPWRLPVCSFSRSVRSRALAPTRPRCLLYLTFTKPPSMQTFSSCAESLGWFCQLEGLSVCPVSVSQAFLYIFFSTSHKRQHGEKGQRPDSCSFSLSSVGPPHDEAAVLMTFSCPQPPSEPLGSSDSYYFLPERKIDLFFVTVNKE